MSELGLVLGHDLPPAHPPITARVPRFRLPGRRSHTKRDPIPDPLFGCVNTLDSHLVDLSLLRPAYFLSSQSKQLT